MQTVITGSRISCQFSLVAPGGKTVNFNVDKVAENGFCVYRIDSDNQPHEIGLYCSTITKAQNLVAAYMGRMYMNAIVEGTLEIMDIPPID